MKPRIEYLGRAFSYLALGFLLGMNVGGTAAEKKYHDAMLELDKSYRAALSWQGPRDLENCRSMLRAIILTEEDDVSDGSEFSKK